jgi:hypothetical protein
MKCRIATERNGDDRLSPSKLIKYRKRQGVFHNKLDVALFICGTKTAILNQPSAHVLIAFPSAALFPVAALLVSNFSDIERGAIVFQRWYIYLSSAQYSLRLLRRL